MSARPFKSERHEADVFKATARLLGYVHPGRIQDLRGQRFGRLVVRDIAPLLAPGARVRWNAVCDCGNVTTVKANCLRNGDTSSCGCLHTDRLVERTRARLLTHGMSKTTEFRIWTGMRTRCLNPNDPGFKYYGGRGIGICRRWESFEVFLHDMGPRPIGTSIDRIDNSKGYQPDNCRWATNKDQARNQSTNRVLTSGGRSMCVAAWSEELGINAPTLLSRLRRGWCQERVLTTPTDERFSHARPPKRT
jgi:hypothetical protein